MWNNLSRKKKVAPAMNPNSLFQASSSTSQQLLMARAFILTFVGVKLYKVSY